MKDEKILVLRGGAVGDVLVTKGALRWLRLAYPDYSLVLHTRPDVGELFLNAGLVDDLLPADTVRFPSMNYPHNTTDTIVERVRPCKVVLSMSGQEYADDSYRSRNLQEVTQNAPVITIKNYIGDDKESHVATSLFLDAVQKMNGFARSNGGIPVGSVTYSVHDLLSYRMPMLRYCSTEPYLVIHPTCGEPNKAWSLNNYAMTIKQLRQEAPHLKLIVTGTKQDKGILDQLIQEVPENSVQLFCGRSLVELASLLAGAEIVLCADCGVGHLSSAVQDFAGNAPESVILFVPKSHRLRCMWEPYGDKIHALSAEPGDTDIAVPRVMSVIKRLLPGAFHT